MGKKKKYYVVWVGAHPGVYDSWDECKEQITAFPGAKYKSFLSNTEATLAYRNGPSQYLGSKSKRKNTLSSRSCIQRNTISVDAACSGNPGAMEYRGVITDTGREIFRKGPYRNATNNIGEFLALVHILALLHKREDTSTVIYSDSRTAMAWVRKTKANTKHFENNDNPKLEKLVMRAENWIKKHGVKNEILKWHTKEWGEIPADFGRK